MNLFAKAKAWLPQKLLQAAGVVVSVTRAGLVTENVAAIVGQTAFVNKADGATRVTVGDRDYIFRLSDYPYQEPALGDRITELVGGELQVHEIMNPDTGEPAWRYSDPGQSAWRIHAKRVI